MIPQFNTSLLHASLIFASPPRCVVTKPPSSYTPLPSCMQKECELVAVVNLMQERCRAACAGGGEMEAKVATEGS